MKVSALLHFWLGDQVGVLAIYCMLTAPGEPEHNGAPCWLRNNNTNDKILNPKLKTLNPDCLRGGADRLLRADCARQA